MYWFAALNGPREEPSLIDRSDLERLFADWHQPIGAILAATPAEAVTLLPIDELARCPRSLWRDNVVLIGDAAHAMTPNLGQGANLALEDAATLALLLAPFAAQPGPAPDRLRRTLADYQRLRLPRVRAVGRRSRRIGVVGQWERPVAVRARDAVLAWLPDAPVSRASVALQAWRPTTRR